MIPEHGDTDEEECGNQPYAAPLPEGATFRLSIHGSRCGLNINCRSGFDFRAHVGRFWHRFLFHS
jgi:hypothetical protein